MSDFDMEIWRYAEPAWREYKSARAYRDLLTARASRSRKAGRHADGVRGDVGRRRAGAGPLLRVRRNPGHSQQATPYRAPREGFHAWAPGHACPHSMLGTTCLAGVLATKAAMQKFGIPGKLKLFGEPAEKMCASKPVHAAKAISTTATPSSFIIPVREHGTARRTVGLLLELRVHV